MSQTEIDVSWAVSFSGPVTLSRCAGVGCDPSPNNGGTVLVISGTSATFLDTGLSANTTYHYEANGTNGFLMAYAGAPVITGVTPNSGSTAGGTSVTLAGYALGNAGTVSVSFGANAGANVNTVAGSALSGDNFPYQVTTTSPALTAGAVDVTVKTNGGTSTTSSADQFTFISPVSVIPTFSVAGAATSFTVSCSPSSSCPDSLGTLTATGPGTLFQTFGVNPGGPSGCSVTPCTVNTLALAPAGTYTVTLYGNSSCGGCTDGTPLGSATFTVNAAIPTVSGISPATGRPGGGTSVTLTGTGFTFATAVNFGATAATFTINSDTSITAVNPAGKGAEDVTVTTAGGTSATSSADLFTYATPFAVVGQAGTSFKLSGANFDTATAPSVLFTPAKGGLPTPVNTICTAGQAQDCIQKGDTPKSIVVKAPNGPAGLQIVSVAGADTGSEVLYFDYGPAILKVTKGGGSSGTTVVIKGGNFGTSRTALPTVTFGGTPLPGKCGTLKLTIGCIASASNTSITVKAPSGTANETIGVTAISGLPADDLTKLGAQFDFNGAITSISPQGGAGGTVVHIKGQGFGTSTPAVSFGGAPLASSCANASSHGCIKSSNASNITVVAPDGTGLQDVSVSTAAGDADDQTPVGAVFTYGPAVTSVSPLAGSATTIITINGVNLVGTALPLVAAGASTPITPLPRVTIGTTTTNAAAKCSTTIPAPCIVSNNAGMIKVKPPTGLNDSEPITVTVGGTTALNLTAAPLEFNFGAGITGLR